VVVAAVAIGGVYYFTQKGGTPSPKMPSKMEVLAQNQSLKEIMKVTATSTPGPGTEIANGDQINCSTDVKRIGGTWPDQGVTYTFAVFQKGEDLDVALLVGKGNVNPTSYVNNNLGNDWRLVGSDSMTLPSLENSKTFNLSVTYTK